MTIYYFYIYKVNLQCPSCPACLTPYTDEDMMMDTFLKNKGFYRTDSVEECIVMAVKPLTTVEYESFVHEFREFVQYYPQKFVIEDGNRHPNRIYHYVYL